MRRSRIGTCEEELYYVLYMSSEVELDGVQVQGAVVPLLTLGHLSLLGSVLSSCHKLASQHLGLLLSDQAQDVLELLVVVPDNSPHYKTVSTITNLLSSAGSADDPLVAVLGLHLGHEGQGHVHLELLSQH